MECSQCAGEGRLARTDIMDIEVPAGVVSGSRIRYEGQGDAGRHGGPPGDLFVIANVTPHRFFTRVGDNVQCVLPISFTEAALGAKIEVPTVEGPAVVRVPPGTQNGQILRLRGKGAPSLVQPGSRGDQLLEVKVVTPRIADERSKEILREFALLNAEDLRKDAWKTGER
jgi:molecular chaperone DnaJ